MVITSLLTNNNNSRDKTSVIRQLTSLTWTIIIIIIIIRTASKGEITKAYRKLAAQYHPDQYQGDDKEFAQKTFIDIAAAKEVLTDPGW